MVPVITTPSRSDDGRDAWPRRRVLVARGLSGGWLDHGSRSRCQPDSQFGPSIEFAHRFLPTLPNEPLHKQRARFVVNGGAKPKKNGL
jgi:hypothetical protein